MKRKQPDAMIIGDTHYREDTPVCRLDDLWETQVRKNEWFRNLWEKLGRPLVIQPGDVFHRWKSSPRVLSMVLKTLPPMVSIPGLPGQHNASEWERDPLYTLVLADTGWRAATRVTENTKDATYGTVALETLAKIILLSHTMILEGPAPFDGERAEVFLRWASSMGYSLVVTGHNHQPIVATDPETATWLVNPGSFTRQTASETHQPRIYLWYAQSNTLEPVFVPIEEGVMSREHIAVAEHKDERISAFVESLSGQDRDLSIDFRDNCLRRVEKVRAEVRQRVMESLPGGVGG